ncbi:hypothetical protein [Anabaena sp. CCY 0017]|uniref:hypothetical protein n=1 Tax=Anabaena sp. CCY 0017 TaxID=3103866 RepID=UPI0039C677EF
MVHLGIPCPVLNQKPCSDCPKAERKWYIDKILDKLAFAKGVCKVYKTLDITEKDIKELNINDQQLTNAEKCWLLLLLDNFSVQEIADKLKREKKGLNTDLSKTIYKYVSIIAKKKVSDWAQVSSYLDRLGYRRINEVKNQNKLIRLVLIPDFEELSEEQQIEFVNILSDRIKQKYPNQLLTPKDSYYEEEENEQEE